jgi:FkbM family methyltransferase
MYLGEKLREATLDLPNRSLIHVGAHTGEEGPFYAYSMGCPKVLWIEANPRLIVPLQDAVRRFGNQVVEHALLADRDGDEVDFHIANNTHCSSLLKLKDHAEVYPQYKFVDTIRLKTRTLDTLLDERKEHAVYSVLMMDVQGAEGLVLAGATRILPSIQVVYAEINFREMYQGCPLAAQLDRQLAEHGFVRWATMDTGCGWGDSIYRRK